MGIVTPKRTVGVGKTAQTRSGTTEEKELNHTDEENSWYSKKTSPLNLPYIYHSMISFRLKLF
jgi:hypothetical protein